MTSKRIERKPSLKTVLEPDEIKFIKAYLAFGKKNVAEAYRRSFMRKHPTKDGWVDAERGVSREVLMELDPVPAKLIGKRATALLNTDYIQDAMAELDRSTSDIARDVLADQLRFGDDALQARAVERVFKEEDRLGLQDAVERYWEIMESIAAEVVIPMPIVSVKCASCGHHNEVDYKVRIPLGEFRGGSSEGE